MMHILILPLLLLAACAPALDRELAATDLTSACVEAAGTHPEPIATELRALCTPEAIRGRSVEQLTIDAARVRKLSGRG